MASPSENSERLEAEISLLEAMYPGCITYTPRSRELWFKASSGEGSSDTATNNTNPTSGGEFKLRLPDTYPVYGLPSLISARDGAKNDLREQTRHVIGELNLAEGEEGLDRIIGAFEGLVLSDLMAMSTDSSLPQKVVDSADSATTNGAQIHHSQKKQQQDPMAPKTVIIWLHHLLATSKRKLAITPTLTASNPSYTTENSTGSSSLSGITKPGYPGIMIFSGSSALVDAHVRELKDLNWQAFQVRYDSSEEEAPNGDDGGVKGSGSPLRWKFAHEEEHATAGGTTRGTGKIVEVETMADVVKAILRENDRDVFLRSVGVK